MITCGCGSPDWIAAAPGTAADATPYPPSIAANVSVLKPGPAIPTVAWCADCLRRMGRLKPRTAAHG